MKMVLIEKNLEGIDIALVGDLILHYGLKIERAGKDDTAHHFYRYNTEVRRTSRTSDGILCLPAIILPLFYVKSGGIWYSGIIEGKKNVEEFLRFLLEELGK